jgi:hypothetical protein
LLPDCYYDPKFNCYFIMNFFKRPLFESLAKYTKMAKFNGYKTFMVPKTLKQKLQHLKAWLLHAIPQKFHAWNRSGFAFTNKSVK